MYFAAVITGFVTLIWGADRFVLGAAAFARNLGVSTMLIGLTIVGFGTSAPEVLVGAMASLQGNAGLAVGNAIGSNIANIALVLGATALVAPLAVSSQTVRQEIPILLLITLATLGLLLNGELSRLDGAIMLTGLAVLLGWMVHLGMSHTPEDNLLADYDAEIRSDLSLNASVAWTAVGLLVLLTGAQALVWGGSGLAEAIGVSDTVIGVTVVAIGTSLPELAVSVAGARKREHDLVLGNIMGSNMFNLLAVLGIASAITPIDLDPTILAFHFPSMVVLTLALFAMSYDLRGGPGRINRIEGAMLLTAFASYHYMVYRSAL
ncbi:MAG: calcium/sodium antiporter [Pseudomonadota bacterium]